MNKLILLFVTAALVLTSCNQGPRQEGAEEIIAEEVVSVTIEELLASPVDFEGKEVVVRGMVTHVCKHGGQKCFVLAEDGETQLRINTSEKIDEFKLEMEGSTVEFKGIFNVLTTVQSEELLEEHESKEHHANEMAHTEAEKSSYFIDAVSYAEIRE